MIDSLKQRIINYVKQNQPVSIPVAAKDIGIAVYSFRKIKKEMENKGLLFSRQGFGLFESEEYYNEYVKVEGKKRMQAFRAHGLQKEKYDVVDGIDTRKAIMSVIDRITTPMTCGEIGKMCGVGTKAAYRIVSELCDLGTLVHDGGTYGRRFILASEGGVSDFDSKEVSRRPKGFRKYNPKRNGVVQAYLNSPARQRIMMVYGRAA
ncbi:hypothetical protein PGO13_19940 [Klebsiella aerogenes]